MSGQISQRPRAPQSARPRVARRLNQLRKYLDATGLQQCMEDICAQLLRRTELPPNPYPGLLCQIQQQAERLRLTNSTPPERILSDLSLPTFSTAVGYISGAGHSSRVWGLPAVLRCVSPAHLQQYRWLLANATPPSASLRQTSALSVQVISALTGPGIFTGTFYDLPPAVDILLNFVIIGTDVKRAVARYAECLRDDVVRTIKQQHHLVFRLVVPVDENGQKKVFSRAEALGEALGEVGALRSWVSAALLVRQPVRLECLWRQNVGGEDFIRGAKLYSLTIVQPSEGAVQERVLDYSEHPLTHLYCSVFLRQSHVEAYCGIFIPREEAIDKDLQQPRTKATHSAGAGGGEWPRNSRQRVSTASKVPLHGFQYAARGRHCPDSSSVLEPIKTSMLQRIASIPLSTGAFDVTYYSILIILMELGNSGNQEHRPPMTDREDQLLEALMQLHRFLHGSASHIWKLLSLTQTICSVLESEDTQVSCREIYTILAEKCRKLMSDFLDSDYRKVSSDFATLSKLWKREMETSLCALLEGPNKKLLNNFRVVLSIGTVMLIQAVEHSLPWTPVLTHMKTRADEGLPGASPGSNQVYSEHSPQGAARLPDDRAQSTDVAGNAIDGPHDELNAALLKYGVDCRLDWHWEQCLLAIFAESPLPPNPYPIVASEFIKASLRMDLWQMRDEDILRQVLQCAPELVDHENHIFQVPGCSAFGFESALGTLNADTFQSVLGLTSLMGNSSFPHRCQDFKVAVGLGVNISSTWLGSLSPFLTALELTEFYYLKGPPGCHREALQVYAQLVQSHMKEVQTQVKGMLTFSVRLCEGQRWSASDILTYPSAFTEAFANSAARGQQASLKVLLPSPLTPWKILPIVKYFVLYYFEGPEECWQSFPQHNTVGLYQTVFLSKEAAAFHCQRVVGKPFSGTSLHTVMLELDDDIGKSFLKEEILRTYRLAALKCLISQRYDVVPECWRMLHSLAAQLEGLNRLNETLQELLLVENVNNKSSVPLPGKLLDEALLMYQQVLQATLERESCPAPSGFLEVALSKIQAAVGGAGGRGSVDQLRDVSVMCRAVADVVGWEIHALCPEVGSLLQSLGKGGGALQATITAPHALGPGAAAVVGTGPGTARESPPLIYDGREALDSW